MSSYNPRVRSTPSVTPWALDELPMALPMHGASDEVAVRREPVSRTLTAAEIEALEGAAYARGFADGEQAAQDTHAMSVASVLQALHDAAAAVSMHDARWHANAEANIAALAVMVARHIVQREVTTNSDIVSELVQQALAQFPVDQAVTVRLHPEDAAWCEIVPPRDTAGRKQEVYIVADPQIARGGCLAEGRERIIDGRVDTSLERAYRSIGQVQA